MSTPHGHGFRQTILGLMAESLLIFAGAVALTAGLILLGYALARKPITPFAATELRPLQPSGRVRSLRPSNRADRSGAFSPAWSTNSRRCSARSP